MVHSITVMKRYEAKKKPVFKKNEPTKQINSASKQPKKVAPQEEQQGDSKFLKSIPELKIIQPLKLPISTFVPQIYRFRLPGGKYSLEGTNSAETPPFWLLLDHTLGVIWTLFSPSSLKQQLGVSQLQWALEFLKRIRTLQGDNPKDVRICIKAIEDKLIDSYAKINNPLDKDKDVSSHNWPQILSSHHSDVVNGLRRRSASMLSLVSNSSRQSSGRFPKLFYPVSVTYEEILARSPKYIEQIYHTELKSTTRSHAIIEEEESTVKETQVSKSNTTLSYGKVLEFLTDWRREQVNRIQNELKRLHSIEAFMGTLESNNFQPFVEKPVVQLLCKINTHPTDDLLHLTSKPDEPK